MSEPAIVFKKKSSSARATRRPAQSLESLTSDRLPTAPAAENPPVDEHKDEQHDHNESRQEDAQEAHQKSDSDDDDDDGDTDHDSSLPLRAAKRARTDFSSKSSGASSSLSHAYLSSRNSTSNLNTNDKQVTMLIEDKPAPINPNKPKWSGPQKAIGSNVRVISRFDYQPDLCKDYKETGYCGYGDSCKFMHDRGDYKSGWQLENDWNAEQKMKKDAALLGQALSSDENYEIHDDDSSDDLPFACLICRRDFVAPVVTKCKHYFCESCALAHYVKDTKCFVCKAQTSGIFNTANEIIARKKKIAQSHTSGDDEHNEELEKQLALQQEDD